MSNGKQEKCGIICPKCGSSKSLVYDSRKRKYFNVVRRRECKDCGFRYTTVETLYGYEFVKDTPEKQQEKGKDGKGRR